MIGGVVIKVSVTRTTGLYFGSDISQDVTDVTTVYRVDYWWISPVSSILCTQKVYKMERRNSHWYVEPLHIISVWQSKTIHS